MRYHISNSSLDFGATYFVSLPCFLKWEGLGKSLPYVGWSYPLFFLFTWYSLSLIFPIPSPLLLTFGKHLPSDEVREREVALVTHPPLRLLRIPKGK